MPRNVVHNINGVYYLNDDLSTKEECIEGIIEYGQDIIIKPTIETNGGHNIVKVNKGELNRQYIEEQFDLYGCNFACQEVVKQHPALASFNDSSINTIRISTYMNFKKEVKVLYALQRFGNKGSVVDNASSGGRYCGINKEDGSVLRIVHRDVVFKTEPMDDSVTEFIPCFDKIKRAVIGMHYQLPQFGLIAWDISVDPEEHITLIEYNFFPGYDMSQCCVGPVFEEEDLTELMTHVSNIKLSQENRIKVEFQDKPGYIRYM